MKILSLEVFCPELQLDLVVAHLTGVHRALAEVQRDLRAGPRVNITVSGDWAISLGSIIIPLHVNCLASSANTAMLVKPKISANTPIRNIGAAPQPV